MMKEIFLASLAVLIFSCQQNKITLNHADIGRIEKDLTIITKTSKSRSYLNLETLNFVADYIHSELSKVCDTVYYQDFNVNGKTYKNVIGSICTDKKKRLIIGAHYDACGNQEGADDNASAVSGVLELARLLSKEKPNYRVDFVAYSLEEPPFFDTPNMGSYVHAKSMHDQHIDVKGMICLETIGYFNDSAGSQSYPLGMLSWFYGDIGNYIVVVQKYNNGTFGSKIKNLMTRQKLIPTKSFTGPKFLQGIDFSDHRSYWKFGYDAVMITNTAFFRNPNYHKIGDTMETLDLGRMCKVIDEVCSCVLNL